MTARDHAGRAGTSPPARNSRAGDRPGDRPGEVTGIEVLAEFAAIGALDLEMLAEPPLIP